MRWLLALVVCGLVVACGSDDVSSDVAEWRGLMERICREAERDGERLARRHGDMPEDALPFFRGVLELLRSYQERYEGIEPPEEFADEDRRSAELNQRTVAVLEELVEALERADDPVDALRRKFPPLLLVIDESNKLSADMGLDDCVAPPLVPEPNPPGPS